MHIDRRTKRRLRTAGLAALLAGATGLAIAALPQPAAAAGSGTDQVIVLLADQLAGTPATAGDSKGRQAAATGSQDAVLSRLAGPAPTDVRHYGLGNAFAATVTPDQATALAADPAVAAVLPDSKITFTAPKTPTAPEGPTAKAQAQSKAQDRSTPAASPALCAANPNDPLLEPEAMGSIDAGSVGSLADGNGVKVGFLSDALDPNYADFVRPDGSKVFVDYQDFSGDGLGAKDTGGQAFGDASSIAAQGTVAHDLSSYVNQAHPLPAGCTIRLRGVAPGASLVGLDIASNTATNSALLQAIDYAVTVDHVDVLDESFGLNQYPDTGSREMFNVFNDEAVAAGVTVINSSGNAGSTNTIDNPAADPKMISVGATTDNQVYAQTGDAGFGLGNGKWINDNVSSVSSGGITQNGQTIDLVAPGDSNWADCEPGFSSCLNLRSPAQPTDLETLTGTAEAAPLTAGAAALVIQAYRKTHGVSPSPDLVKHLLTSTARDLGLPATEQGAGMLDATAAVRAALAYPGGRNANSGANLVLSTDQLTLAGAPGSTQYGTVTATDAGSAPLSVAVGTRGFTPLSGQTQSPGFDSTALPTFADAAGASWAYREVPFSVSAGAQRLTVQMAWQGNQKTVAGNQVTPTMRLTLLAPDGSFVANSQPQGGPASSNYANLDVRDPAAGQWTAVLYSPAGPTGYTGTVQLATDTQRADSYGQASQSTITLAPGQSRRVTVALTTPASSGDAAYSITFAGSNGQRTSVSAILRSIIPLRTGSGDFSGVITGGNGRPIAPAQTFSYAFDVPRDAKGLQVGIHLPDPNDLVAGVLVDPNGELGDVNSNASPTASGSTVQGKGIQLVARPMPGEWHLSVVVQNPVSGSAIAQRFTGTVSLAPQDVRVTGLPTSPHTTVPAGHTATVQVSVHNTGVEPLAVGIDPRTNTVQTMHPVVVMGQGELAMPANPAIMPAYMTPPEITELSVMTTSTMPAQVELQSSASGIDVFGSLCAAQHGDTVSVATVREHNGFLGSGLWYSLVQELGPFGPSGAPAGHTSYSASMRGYGFDPSVTSTTGDPFAQTVNAAAGPGTPVIVAPGATATIPVTVTASGARGSVVSGHLNVVTEPNVPTTGAFGALPISGTGEVLATVPYTYRIG